MNPIRPRGILFALLVGASAFAGCFNADPADGTPGSLHAYVNGKLWTADDTNPEATALVVRGDTIVFVGSDEDAEAAYPDATVHDLQGRRVTPGFIDSHSHFVRIASAWDCDRANNPFRPTYDASAMATLEVENARAQRAATHYQTNATDNTPVDAQTTIADKAAAKRGLECAMKEANAMGLTMNTEAGTSSWDFLTVLQELEAEGKVTERQSLYLTPPQVDEAERRGIQTGWGTDLVRVAGVKLYSDGWMGPRTAALLQPFSDRPASRGVLFLEEDEATSWIRRVVDAGLKPATHTIGDQGVAVVLDAYQTVGNPGDARFTFEHASLVNPALIEGMAAVGATASYQLSFATSDQSFAESALGAERVKYLYAWKTLQDAGVVLSGGSDFPIETVSPLWGLQRVVTRQELDGRPDGGWHPSERLSIEDALRTITINAAYNVFMEHRTGSLEVGKLADFVVLDQDILTIDPHEIAKTCVLQTFVGGRLVHDPTQGGVACQDVAYTGVLPPRDPAVIARLHEQLEHEALLGTRLG